MKLYFNVSTLIQAGRVINGVRIDRLANFVAHSVLEEIHHVIDNHVE